VIRYIHNYSQFKKQKHFYSILEELSSEDAYERFYSEIPKEVYTQIISTDPFSNRRKLSHFAKWLLKLYSKDNLKIEDLYKATEYINTFNKVKPKLDVGDRDINKFNSLTDMLKVIKPYLDGERENRSGKEIIKDVKEKEAIKHHNGEKWTVIQPLTEKAACYYGKNTEWCTAADDSHNSFDEYNYQGPLYINIDKINNQKYQFHFETQQFMDENDEPIDLLVLLNSNKELDDFYENHLSDSVDSLSFKDLEITDDGCFIVVNNWKDFTVAFAENGRNTNPAEFLHNTIEDFSDDFVQFDRSDIENFINDIDEPNLIMMKDILKERDLEFDEDDFDEILIDNFEDELSFSLSDAKRIANDGEIYKSITDAIKDHYGITDITYDYNNKLRLKLFKRPKNVLLYMTAGSYFVDSFAELYDGENKIDYTYPYYGFDGEIDTTTFNEILNSKLHDI
jgi:hypothetical protein